jgi:hypothetical protein
MSGYAIEKLIESCVPGISNIRRISAPDLDVLLLAIRAATSGTVMPLAGNCPSCNHENEFECDLSGIIATMHEIPARQTVALDSNVVVHVRPYDLEVTSKISLASFEEARKMQAAETSDMTLEAKTAVYNASYSRLAGLNMMATSASVSLVEIPGARVTDAKMIAEFVNNMSKDWYKKIEDHLKELNNKGMDKTVNAVCVSCKHEWKHGIEFNPSLFFE